MFGFSFLKGIQDASTNFDGLFDGFEPGCMGFPLVVAEVGVAHTARENQVVVFV